MVKIEKACVDCGEPVSVEKPTKGAEKWMVLGVMCRKCSNAEDRVRADREEESRQEARKMRILSSGLPGILAEVRLPDLQKTDQNSAALAKAEEWGRGALTGLVMTGPVGVGKTWTAAAAANLYLDRKPLRWFSVARMLAQARAGFKNPARDEVNAVLLNASMALVMDDIDKVNPTDFARDILFQAIDERVNNRTPLLVTTNMRYPEIEETYGEPIASRLAGYCEAVRIEGADRRKG